MTVPGPAAGGRKSFGVTYDKAYRKWLPVPYDWVSPDGSKYVYPTPTFIAVVSVSSNKVVQILNRIQWAYWWPLDVEDAGVWAYEVFDSTVDSPRSGGGLALLPFTGPGQSAAANATSSGYFYAMRGSIAYSYFAQTWVAPGDKSTGSIGRSNLSNGQGSFIFGTPYGSASPYVWAGVAMDTAFLITGAPSRLIGIVGADTAQITPDLAGDLPLVGLGQNAILGDSHGVWIAGNRGLYLLRQGSIYLASDKTGVLAGGCA